MAMECLVQMDPRVLAAGMIAAGTANMTFLGTGKGDIRSWKFDGRGKFLGIEHRLAMQDGQAA